MKRALTFAIAALLASAPTLARHTEIIRWVDVEGVERVHVVHVPDKYDHMSIDTRNVTLGEDQISQQKENEAWHQENRNRFSYDGKIGHETVYYNPVLKQRMYVNQDTGATRFENTP